MKNFNIDSVLVTYTLCLFSFYYGINEASKITESVVDTSSVLIQRLNKDIVYYKQYIELLDALEQLRSMKGELDDKRSYR